MEYPNSPFEVIVIFALGLFLTVGIAYLNSLYQRKKDNARIAYIRGYSFPDSVNETLKQSYSSLSLQQIGSALEQLRLYFMVCNAFEGKPIGMPSKLVDAAWHSFILSTRHYSEFCDQAFGWYLHHTPEKDKSNANTSDNLLELGRMVKGARMFSESDLTIPKIFRIDAEMGLVNHLAVLSEQQIESAVREFENHTELEKSEREKSSQTTAACSASAACGCGGGSC